MTNSGRNCAYCGATRDLSREHVFPECLYERIDDTVLVNVRGKTEKVVNSQLTVRDVCAPCNNGPLSVLDAYFCNLYDTYFNSLIRAGECVKFSYDFDLLLRCLLKIGFNMARARGWSFAPSMQVRHYVLGRAARPRGLHLYLQLVIPSKLKQGSLPNTPDLTEIPPIPARVELANLSLLRGHEVGFMASFNCYSFWVLLESSKAPSHVRKRGLKQWLKNVPGAQELSEKNRAVVYASSVHVLQDLSTSKPFLRNLGLARKWKAENQRKG